MLARKYAWLHLRATIALATGQQLVISLGSLSLPLRRVRNSLGSTRRGSLSIFHPIKLWQTPTPCDILILLGLIKVEYHQFPAV